MSFDFDFSVIPEDASRLQEGNADRANPGRGMAIIRRWVEYGAVNGQAHNLELEIVAWTTPSDVGKIHEESIFHQDKTGKGHPMKRITTLAMAAGLFTPVDVARWKAERTNPSIDMQAMINRPIMIELTMEPDQRDPAKKYLRIGNIGLGFWHCQDPRTKDWPKSPTVLNRSAAVIGPWVTPTQTTAAPAQGAAKMPW
jgi:hypothetical protein